MFQKSPYYICISLLVLGCILASSNAIQSQVSDYNIVWKEQSKNASESMPCGGGSIGANVWVENGDLFLYLQQSGWFDENNTALKAGRIRVHLSPNPFAGNVFKQTLVLKDGKIDVYGKNGNLFAEILIWVDPLQSIVHTSIKSSRKIIATASYESWRYADRNLSSKENNANSWKWAKQVKVITKKDSIGFSNNSVLFFHKNSDSTVFDYAVKQQGLDSIKTKLTNPLQNLISGGIMWSNEMIPAEVIDGKYAETDFKAWQLKSKKASYSHTLQIALQVDQTPNLNNWLAALRKKTSTNDINQSFELSRKWWNELWEKSFIQLSNKDDKRVWEIGRNYQLFRYMLAANAYGKYPTKFNGGLFTVDPIYTDSSIHGTPDHRNWGGGTFTAQNQRLVYWPLLQTGDIDFMKPQFDFYKNNLQNATLRTSNYWQHAGASFSEQLENFGLPNPAEYGYKRPINFDKGVEYNAWLEYEWDTALEFCMMMLESEKYHNKNIQEYIPLIKSCLQFFDEHYQYLAKQRGAKALDGNGQLVLYPGSAGETFKMATNASSTIAGLRTVTTALLQSAYLPIADKKYFNEFLARIPSISFREFGKYPTIAPAKNWERVNNVESPQLYPVFPWKIYGVGKKGLDTAINTYRYDTLALKFRTHIGWKQDNIFAAELGLKDEAARLTLLKLQNSTNKFPAFWGPGFDWTPDHNWGGSGMIGLQEMLMQTEDQKIILFPSWPRNWDVHFKLHAPYNTSIEVTILNGVMTQLIVLPKEREKDIVNMLQQQ